jgi:mevalonate kinase
VGGIGQANGKLILFGEHAAVYGHTAVGVSLPEQVTAQLWSEAAEAWDLDAIAAGDREMLGRILSRLEALLPELSSRVRSRVRIQSDVPRGVGFGSSAAVCAALARAALTHAGAPVRDPHREWSLAHDAERLFHGTPSGIDTGLSLIGGLVAFRPRPPALPDYELLVGASLHLVVAAVPRDQSCRALVARLGERMRAGHEETRDALQHLGAIAETARKALADSAADRSRDIAELADQAMVFLRRLGLGSPRMDRLLEAGKKAGALGGKLSGAGGGGAFFLVTRDAESAAGIAAVLGEEASRAGISLAAPARILSAGGAGAESPGRAGEIPQPG